MSNTQVDLARDLHQKMIVDEQTLTNIFLGAKSKSENPEGKQLPNGFIVISAATWCGHCRNKKDLFNAMSSQLKDKRIPVFVFLDKRDRIKNKAIQYVLSNQLQDQLPEYMDMLNSLKSFPTILLVNKYGTNFQTYEKDLAYDTPSEIDQTIQRIESSLKEVNSTTNTNMNVNMTNASNNTRINSMQNSFFRMQI
jgi:hypothetical protein